MKKNDFAKKVFEYQKDFMEYALKDPGVLKEIPQGSILVFLPEDDLEFAKASLKLAKKQAKKSGQKLAYIKIEKKKVVREEFVPEIVDKPVFAFA